MKFQPTPSQTVGPFFHLGLTHGESVGRIAGEAVSGEHIRLRFRVLDGDGSPVPDAMIELWQADSEGHYCHPEDPRPNSAFLGYGRLPTDEHGTCTFETIKPGSIAAPDGHTQAPHVNVSVFARGLLKRLATRIYFAQERLNNEDPILALVPENRRQTLVAKRDESEPDLWNFAVRLRGQDETVFFDI